MYDPLFEKLAEAKSLPSRGFRTAMTALDIPGQAVQGIEGGLQARNDINALRYQPQIVAAQRKASMLDNFGKLSESIGPDRALGLMGPSLEAVGIDTSQLGPPASGGGSGSTYSPEQLEGMGKFGQTQLGMRKTTEDLQNNAPYTPEDVRSIFRKYPDIGEGLIKAHGGGPVPSRVVTSALQPLSREIFAPMVGARVAGSITNELPSNSPAGTAAGAAYQVKVAARQGKSLISKFNSPQALALGAADLARVVQRAAPDSQVISGADYANNLQSRWAQIQQQITSNPSAANVPLLRKQMYDLFNEMDNSASPWIQNKLANVEDTYGAQGILPPNWNAIKEREMGGGLPDVAFDPNPAPTSLTSQSNPNVASGVPQVTWKTATGPGGQRIRSRDNWATSEPIAEGQ